MTRLEAVALFLIALVINFGLSYLFALAGQPNAVWLWRMFGVID